jgi:uncharacterized membrane protein HdeD (DUF308 family)
MALAPARSPILTAEAVLLIVLGAAALLLPLLAGLFVGTIIGVVLLITGIVGLLSAFSGGAHLHRGWSTASAVIALVFGFLILFNPLVGVLSLTLLLGAYLLLDGISLIGLGLDQRRRGSARWPLLLLSGVVDLILAALIVLLSGIGSAVVVGVVLGVDLIAAGIALLALHRAPVVGDFASPTI